MPSICSLLLPVSTRVDTGRFGPQFLHGEGVTPGSTAKAFCPRSQDVFPGHLEKGVKGCFSCLILFFRGEGAVLHVCVGGWQDGDHPASSRTHSRLRGGLNRRAWGT